MKRQVYKLKDTAQTDYTTLDPQNLHLFVDETQESGGIGAFVKEANGAIHRADIIDPSGGILSTNLSSFSGAAPGTGAHSDSGGKANGQFSNAHSGGESNGENSYASGKGLKSNSFSETALGAFNENITPHRYDIWDSEDLIFSIGIGQDNLNRLTSFSAYKNGGFKFLSRALSNITNQVKGFFALDENARPNVHDGTQWNPIAYLSDISGGVVPDASPTVKGITKIYNNLGANTDGSINQKIITDNLNLKTDIDNWKKEIMVQDLFVSNNLTNSIYSAAPSGAGSSVAGAQTLTDTTKQGAAILKTGTTATGSSALQLGTASPVNSIKLGIGELIRETRLYIPTLSDATNRFLIPFGFMQNSNALNTNGIYIVYDEGGKSLYGAVGGSPNFICMTVANLGSAKTVTDSLVPVTASTWYTLKIVVNATATEVKFYINNILVATHTTDIYTTTDVHGRFSIVKTDGTTSRQVELQYMRDILKRSNPLP